VRPPALARPGDGAGRTRPLMPWTRRHPGRGRTATDQPSRATRSVERSWSAGLSAEVGVQTAEEAFDGRHRSGRGARWPWACARRSAILERAAGLAPRPTWLPQASMFSAHPRPPPSHPNRTLDQATLQRPHEARVDCGVGSSSTWRSALSRLALADTVEAGTLVQPSPSRKARSDPFTWSGWLRFEAWPAPITTTMSPAPERPSRSTSARAIGIAASASP